MQPIQFPGNIELVKKYYDKIDAALIASSRLTSLVVAFLRKPGSTFSENALAADFPLLPARRK